MGATDVLEKAQPLILVDCNFCTIKQLLILKLMDDREVVEVEVETSEHRSQSTSPKIYSRSRPTNSGGLIWPGLSFD